MTPPSARDLHEERLARVALGVLGEPGDPRLIRLVAELGAVTVRDHLLAERDLGDGVLSDVHARLGSTDPHRELAQARRLGIRYVITHEHPVPFSKIPDGFAALAPELRLVATFTPFRAGRSPDEAAFEASDAFYLPLAGLDAVERGGPLIRVYAVEASEGESGPDAAKSPP